jgi:uncharacterized phage protein gp47/JayE
MPSPDLSPYIDLTIQDKDAQDLFDLGKAYLAAQMPEWVPREGNTEVLLMEALAMQLAELIFALNRVPENAVQSLLALYGIERDPGAAPTAQLQFTVVGTQGYNIPAGTVVAVVLPGGLEPINFTTATDLDIAAGLNSALVTAVGDRFTSDANGLIINEASDAELSLVDPIVFVERVAVFGPITGGRDPEDDNEYFSRAIQRFQRYTQTLVTPATFLAFALEQIGVERAFVIDNYNPPSGTPGADGGHITIAVYGEGENVDTPTKDAMLVAMEDMAAVNLQIHIIDPTINTVDITVSVVADEGFIAADVQANVEAALNEFISTENWNWSTTLRRNDIIRVVGNAEGVAYVNTLTVPAADVTLTGRAPLVTPGIFSVTVA